MKKIFVILSLAFLPLMQAEGRFLPRVEKPLKMEVRTPVQTEVKNQPNVLFSPNFCQGACATGLETLAKGGVLSKKAQQLLNRMHNYSGKHSKEFGTVMEFMPAINQSMQIAGHKSEKIKKTMDALVVATTEASKHSWEALPVNNLVQYSRDIAADPRDHEEKINKVNTDCILPALL